MADDQDMSTCPAYQPLPEHDTLNTALLLWHIAKKVIVSPTGCWEWPIGPDRKKRYGTIGEGHRVVRVHRLVYGLCVAAIPDNVGVLHRCDNPPCCRPDHLFLGTQQDNVDDCRQKGRFVQNKAVGVRNGSTKLTPEAVLAIRRAAREEGGSRLLYRRLGAQYGVDPSTIRGIIAGRHWKHVHE